MVFCNRIDLIAINDTLHLFSLGYENLLGSNEKHVA
jgi:hypothetical protein